MEVGGKKSYGIAVLTDIDSRSCEAAGDRWLLRAAHLVAIIR